MCEAVPYRDGFAHSYVLKSGEYIVQANLAILESLRKRIPDLQVTLVGHSLGAGAASIAGMELKERGYNVRVVGFGCPALVSENLAVQCQDYITTVVNDDDVVPRLSAVSVVNLLLDMLQFDWREFAETDIGCAMDDLRDAVSIDLSESVGKALKDSLVAMRELPPQYPKIPVELLIPGTCVHLYRDGVGFSGCLVPNRFFSEIDVSRRMIDDHLFHQGYQKTLLEIERQRTNDHHFRFANTGG